VDCRVRDEQDMVEGYLLAGLGTKFDAADSGRIYAGPSKSSDGVWCDWVKHCEVTLLGRYVAGGPGIEHKGGVVVLLSAQLGSRICRKDIIITVDVHGATELIPVDGDMRWWASFGVVGNEQEDWVDDRYHGKVHRVCRGDGTVGDSIYHKDTG